MDEKEMFDMNEEQEKKENIYENKISSNIKEENDENKCEENKFEENNFENNNFEEKDENNFEENDKNNFEEKNENKFEEKNENNFEKNDENKFEEKDENKLEENKEKEIENKKEIEISKIEKKLIKKMSTQKVEYKQKVYNLISSVFFNESNKEEIIKKLRPYFSLKVIPKRDIDKVYSSVEKIEPDKIDLVEEFKYEEEKYDSTDKFETNSKSLGLSNFDLDLSVSIFKHKQSIKGSYSNDNLDSSSKKTSKIHCIHSIFISLFRIVIDYKDIKLSRQVYEELKEIDNSNVTEKKLLLEKFVEKFGLYIPLELIVGGRINMCFEANNEEEKKDFHNYLEYQIQCSLGANFKIASANADINYKNKKKEENSSNSLNKIENLSIKMIGGDYLCKDDLKKWIKSFNIENLQIIEYKTLIPIYCFIQGFEEKMRICLKDYEEIVLEEINNLIEKYKNEENNFYEGSSKNCNLWSIGIIKDNYKSFTIYQKIINKKLIIKKIVNNILIKIQEKI